MAIITSTDTEATTVRMQLQLPSNGAWRIRCLADTELVVGTEISLDFREQTFKGVVVAVEEQVGQFYLDIRPGKGLLKELPFKAWSSGGLGSILKESVSAAGETLAAESVYPSGQKDWFRLAGRLSQIFEQFGVKWHCLASGKICIGQVWPELSGEESYFLSGMPEASVQQLMLGPETFIWPSELLRAVEYVETIKQTTCVVQTW
jgi:hypothetical protein